MVEQLYSLKDQEIRKLHNRYYDTIERLENDKQFNKKPQQDQQAIKNKIKLDVTAQMQQTERYYLNQILQQKQELKEKRREQHINDTKQMLQQKNNRFNDNVKSNLHQIDWTFKQVQESQKKEKEISDAKIAENINNQRAQIQSRAEQNQNKVKQVLSKADYLLNQKINQKRSKTEQSNQRRIQALTQIAKRPGSQSWLKSASGAGLLKIVDLESQPTTPSYNQQTWNPLQTYITGAESKTQIIEQQEFSKDNTLSDRILNCKKLDKHNANGFILENALNYLHLRQNGCQKDKALLFTSRQRCRIDSTKQYDGPITSQSHSRLKRANNIQQGPSWNGWQMHPAEYESGIQFKPYRGDNNDKDWDRLTQAFDNFLQYNSISKGIVMKGQSIEKLIEGTVDNTKRKLQNWKKKNIDLVNAQYNRQIISNLNYHKKNKVINKKQEMTQKNLLVKQISQRTSVEPTTTFNTPKPANVTPNPIRAHTVQDFSKRSKNSIGSIGSQIELCIPEDKNESFVLDQKISLEPDDIKNSNKATFEFRTVKPKKRQIQFEQEIIKKEEEKVEAPKPSKGLQHSYTLDLRLPLLDFDNVQHASTTKHQLIDKNKTDFKRYIMDQKKNDLLERQKLKNIRSQQQMKQNIQMINKEISHKLQKRQKKYQISQDNRQKISWDMMSKRQEEYYQTQKKIEQAKQIRNKLIEETNTKLKLKHNLHSNRVKTTKMSKQNQLEERQNEYREKYNLSL